MTAITFEPTLADAARRQAVFDGQIFVYAPRPSTRALCAFAREIIEEAFAPLDPRTAQFELPPAEFAAVVARYTPVFLGHPRTHAGLQAVLDELGCALADTYYAVPHLRTATSHGYHTALQAEAYLPYMPPHRDTWYWGMFCSVNWWLPIYDITADNGLAIYPGYWARPVPDGKAIVARELRADTHEHPYPRDIPGLEEQLRPVCPAGGLILFASAHLHSSVPNVSGHTRFSFDFRTVHVDDVRAGRGAPNVDSTCETTSLRQYQRATDGALFPNDLATAYERAIGTTPGAIDYQQLLLTLGRRG